MAATRCTSRTGFYVHRRGFDGDDARSKARSLNEAVSETRKKATSAQITPIKWDSPQALTYIVDSVHIYIVAEEMPGSAPISGVPRFEAYVTSAVATERLPCAHTCEGIYFRKISERRKLTGTASDPIVFLFYGRPAYRPSKTDLSTRNLAYAPVTMVLRRNNILTPHKIFPFDSGAFETQLYKKHLHPAMALDDFLMSGPIDVAGKLVTRFYGTNRDYYLGLAKVAAPPDVEFEAMSYYNLISDPGPTKFDDRCGSIEVQVHGEVVLSDLAVELVILPTQYLANGEYQETILNYWKAEVRDYTIYHDRPNSYISQIRDLIQKYYEQKSYI